MADNDYELDLSYMENDGGNSGQQSHPEGDYDYDDSAELYGDNGAAASEPANQSSSRKRKAEDEGEEQEEEEEEFNQPTQPAQPAQASSQDATPRQMSSTPAPGGFGPQPTLALNIQQLSESLNEETIRSWANAVGREGDIEELKFDEFKPNGKSKGAVYIRFTSPEAAQAVKDHIATAVPNPPGRSQGYAVHYAHNNPYLRASNTANGVSNPRGQGRGQTDNNFRGGRGNFNNRGNYYGGRGGGNQASFNHNFSNPGRGNFNQQSGRGNWQNNGGRGTFGGANNFNANRGGGFNGGFGGNNFNGRGGSPVGGVNPMMNSMGNQMGNQMPNMPFGRGMPGQPSFNPMMMGMMPNMQNMMGMSNFNPMGGQMGGMGGMGNGMNGMNGMGGGPNRGGMMGRGGFGNNKRARTG